MEIPKIYKRIGKYMAAFFLGTLCLIGAYAFLAKKDNVLNDFDFKKGVVKNKGIIKIKASRGKLDAFYLEINNLDKKLIYSRPGQKYYDLMDAFQKGDTVSVYFEESLQQDYLEIFQLEKNNNKIVSLDSYNRNNRIGGWMCLIGGIFIFGSVIYEDKKHWK
jgi:hypothetical protein